MGAGFTPARTKGGRWDEMHRIALVALVESLTAAGQPSAAAAQYGKVGRSEIFPRTVSVECVEGIFFKFFFYFNKNERICFFLLDKLSNKTHFVGPIC